MRLPLLVLLPLIGIALGWSQTQTNPASKAPAAYLRYVCAADGNVPPKAFGEWPLFQPALRLVLEGGPSGPLPLNSGLLPLSSSGYQSVPLMPGKLIIQESPIDSSSKAQNKTLASLNFLPKAGCFYTLLIRNQENVLKLELLEDEPAVLPPTKEGETSPPPPRSLRCFVLEPELRVKITCAEAGIKLENESDKMVKSQNLREGIWSLDIAGEYKKKPFNTSIELDLESPGNWTLFFMKDIYGRIAPNLKKDASLD